LEKVREIISFELKKAEQQTQASTVNVRFVDCFWRARAGFCSLLIFLAHRNLLTIVTCRFAHAEHEMREVDYQLLARRQALLMHQKCASELGERTEFLGYVYQAIKHQLRGDGIESLLHVIRARMAQYKEGQQQVLAWKRP
jgi:hypothetical protein